ncbi:MAG: ferredoxin reductase family protein [Victivallales bacterium]
MKKAAWLSLLFSQIFVITGFWFRNHWYHPMGNQLTGDAAGQLLAYGRLSGLLAAFAILIQVLLVGRVKWFERTFGLDRLTHLHGIIGSFLVIFLVAHPVLVTIGHSMQAGTGRWEQFVDFCLKWEDVLAAAIGLGVMVVALVFSISIIRKRISYETWYWIHLSLYLAIALAFGHQLAVGSDLTDNRYFAAYWRGLYIFTFGNLIFYRVFRPLWSFYRHRFKVARLLRETDDVTSVHIEGRAMEGFPVRAGQFFMVRFMAPGFRWQEHPFSMSSMPDGRHLRLSIKALGDFTRRIPELSPGTSVIVDGPHGIFTSHLCVLPKVLMIAGGIGITPIRPLTEELIAKGKEMVLLYSSRNPEAVVFGKEIEEIALSSAGRLKVIHVISDDPGWTGEKGRIDREKICRLVPDLKEREVYLCGPPPMMKSIRKIMSGLKIPSSQIHFEKFSL